eukprot:3799770-Prymnesium_polylepis.1
MRAREHVRDLPGGEGGEERAASRGRRSRGRARQPQRVRGEPGGALATSRARRAPNGSSRAPAPRELFCLDEDDVRGCLQRGTHKKRA